MRTISCFSGIGCFDLGLERAGMKIVMQIEKAKDARAVLHRQWPNVPKLEDMRHATGSQLPTADVFVGGSPCQDVSIAGRRDGLAGEESGLFFEFHRLLTEARPTWVIFENVDGLLSSNAGCDFATVLAGFTGIVPAIPDRWYSAGIARGWFYNVAWRVLDAQGWGVPQRRKRVFLIGCLATSGRSPANVLFEREGSERIPPTRRTTRQDAASGHRDGAETGDRNGARQISADIAPTLVATGVGTARGGFHWQEDQFLVTVENPVSGAATAKWAKGNGGPAGDELQTIAAYLALDIQQATSKINRTRPGRVAPPLTPRSQTLTWQPHRVAVRRFTPLECERLQGLPDNWTAGHSDTARYRTIGNGGAVPVLRWIGERILEEENRVKGTGE